MEAVRGKPLGEILQAGILEPLGMTTSHGAITNEIRPLTAVAYRSLHDDRAVRPGTPLVPDTWHEYGAGDGSVASTPTDMTAYIRMLLNRGSGPKGQVLSHDSFDLLVDKAVKLDIRSGKIPGHYGYGLMIQELDGRTVIGHGGGHL